MKMVKIQIIVGRVQEEKDLIGQQCHAYAAVGVSQVDIIKRLRLYYHFPRSE